MATPDDVGLHRTDVEPTMHVYSLCFFQRYDVVPAVELIEAADDQEALLIARSKRPSLIREIWDRHRLVARLNRRS